MKYAITRIDNNRTEGWRVCFSARSGERKVVNKTFTDLRYQGRKQALEAAQAYRDEMLVRRKSVSGRYAVKLKRVHSVTGAISSIAWVARFPFDGRSKTRTFNLRKHGYEEAWRLAMNERVKHGGLPPPDAPPPMPEWVEQWLLATSNSNDGGATGRTGVYLLRTGNPWSICWGAEWLVAGHRHRKTWAVSKHGYAGAWALAVEERARYDNLPSPKAPPPMPKWVEEWLSLRSNTSGRTGVFLVRRSSRAGWKMFVGWAATWHSAGKPHTKQWSVRKHGYAGAWRLAVEERARHDNLPSPTEPPPMPRWVEEWLSSAGKRPNTSGRIKPRMSGHAGVRLKSKCIRGDIQTVSWEASIRADGRTKKMSWAVPKYGYAGAWRLAVEERARHDGLPVPKEAPPIPKWVEEWMEEVQTKPKKPKRAGVTLTCQHHPDGTVQYICWRATYTLDGMPKSRQWGIRKHGYVGAWALAVEERARHDGLPVPKAAPPMPKWVEEWLSSRSNTSRCNRANTSGRTGVSLHRINTGGKEFVYWEAMWRSAGKTLKKRWSILKHGYAGAWALAVEERARHDNLPSPTEPPPMPQWVEEWLEDATVAAFTEA